jgi:formylglycine-generating enzyme required for sulfatase activity
LVAVAAVCLVGAIALVGRSIVTPSVPAQACPPAPAAGTLCVVGGIEFVAIPAGTFAMGDASPDASFAAQPVHDVTLDGFWMATTELTLGQWDRFIPATGHPRGRSQGQTDAYPVVGVTWVDATAFTTWLSTANGVTARLPTEAEWEYAARGGLAGKQFPNGDTISQSEANYGGTGALPVGGYAPNGYGLFDMSGNVGEWVGDWYDPTYYAVSPASNPTGPPTQTDPLQRRADRGGGWCLTVDFVRVSARHAGPGSWDEGGTADCLGFRPVLELSPS